MTSVLTTGASGAVTKQVRYQYDPLDRRIEKAIDADGGSPFAPTHTERYLYDGREIELAFIDDLSGGTSTSSKHLYLHGPAVDQVLADDRLTAAADATLWLLADHQGTLRDVVNKAGQPLDHRAYDSYGNLLSENNPSPAVDTLFGYTGRQFDDETGLQYNRARYYDPALGRFISEDPTGFAGGDANLYRYAENDPLTMSDPLGTTTMRLLGGGSVSSASAISLASYTPPSIGSSLSSYGNISVAALNAVYGGGRSSGGGARGTTGSGSSGAETSASVTRPAGVGSVRLDSIAEAYAAQIYSPPTNDDVRSVVDYVGTAAYHDSKVRLEYLVDDAKLASKYSSLASSGSLSLEDAARARNAETNALKLSSRASNTPVTRNFIEWQRYGKDLPDLDTVVSKNLAKGMSYDDALRTVISRSPNAGYSIAARGLKLLGPAAIITDVGVGVWNVSQADSSDRLYVGTREGARVAGGALGGWGGAAGGAAVGAAIGSVFPGPGTIIGGFIGGVVGGVGGAIGGGAIATEGVDWAWQR